MPNIERIIHGQNRRNLRSHNQSASKQTKQCNCRNQSSCPLDGKCLTEALVYKATIARAGDNKCKTYYGATEPAFKTRWRNHLQSLKNPSKRHDTELAKHAWELKDASVEFKIEWQIERQCKPYECGSRACDVCLSEKWVILKNSGADSLNKRNELMNKCRHRAIFKLKKVL